MSARATTASKPKRRSRPVLTLNGAAGEPGLPVNVATLARAQVAAQHAVRHALIERVAYFLAERRGFAPGYELDDWLAAEAEVDAKALPPA